MPLFGSRPTSRAVSRTGSPAQSAPSSRAPSPGLGGGAPSKTDSIRIEGNLYDILQPKPSTTQESLTLPKELHVVLRYTVSFTLTKPVRCESIRAEFKGIMIVTVEEGDGQFRQAEVDSEEITYLNWTLWRGNVLEAGKEHVFEFNGELPPQTPRSLRTPKGRIEHTLTVRFDGVSDSGRMRRTRKTVEVWNPFSMDADSPRFGLEFHADLEPEMVGTSADVDKDLEAFIRFPDQCYKGIGRSFPCEISFPAATTTQLHSITHITVDVLQQVWFLRPRENKTKPYLLAKDIYPITSTVTVQPSTTPQRVSLPLPDPTIHGHFTSPYLRVRHSLHVVFHRRWLGRKVEWEGEVEIFHRDVGWEARGVQGALEIVRGQEGDYSPDEANQAHPETAVITTTI